MTDAATPTPNPNTTTPDQPPAETRPVALHVITPDGAMTTATARLPLARAQDLEARALKIGPGDHQIVLTVPRPGDTPRVIVQSSADADTAEGLLAAARGDL